MKLSVIIPCYNEEENIGTMLEELIPVIKKIPGADSYQVIIVDDHSSDNTFRVIKNMGKPEVSCIRLSERMGSHIAIRAGLRESEGDLSFFLPADGQENPGVLAAMIQKWQGGAMVVWAVSKAKSHKKWHIRKSAELFYKLLGRSGAIRGATEDISRATFFLLDRSVTGFVNRCSLPNAPVHGLVIAAGGEQASVEYERRPRRSGKSKWSLLSLVGLAKDWIIEFSDMPVASLLRSRRRVLEKKCVRTLFSVEERT